MEIAERLAPYGSGTRRVRGRRSGLWAALTGNEGDAADPYPDPASDALDNLDDELARRALLSHLDRLEASGSGGTGAEVIDLDAHRLRRAS